MESSAFSRWLGQADPIHILSIFSKHTLTIYGAAMKLTKVYNYEYFCTAWGGIDFFCGTNFGKKQPRWQTVPFSIISLQDIPTFCYFSFQLCQIIIQKTAISPFQLVSKPWKRDANRSNTERPNKNVTVFGVPCTFQGWVILVLTCKSEFHSHLKEIFWILWVGIPYHFILFYSLDLIKLLRVGNFGLWKIGSVGEPQTQLHFYLA